MSKDFLMSRTSFISRCRSAWRANLAPWVGQFAYGWGMAGGTGTSLITCQGGPFQKRFPSGDKVPTIMLVLVGAAEGCRAMTAGRKRFPQIRPKRPQKNAP